MTKEKLLSLIASWQAGDCPGEILNDAILDFGIDTSSLWESLSGRKYWLIIHLVGVQSHDAPNSLFKPSECNALIDLARTIQNLP